MNKFIIGLVLGIAIAAGLAFYLNNMPNQFKNKVLNSDSSSPISASGPMILAPGTKLQEIKDNASNKAGSSRVIETQAGQGVGSTNASAPSASAPSYDFYNVLQGEKATSSQNKVMKNDEASSPQPQAANYFVEVGVFTFADLADNMKAQLALAGYSPLIKTTQINNKTVYRVLIGPFSRQDQAQEVISELAKQNINSIIYSDDSKRQN